MSSEWPLSTEKCEIKIRKLLTFNEIRTPVCEQYCEQGIKGLFLRDLNISRKCPSILFLLLSLKDDRYFAWTLDAQYLPADGASAWGAIRPRPVFRVEH